MEKEKETKPDGQKGGKGLEQTATEQQKNSEEKQVSLDELLENPELKAEYDARLQEAVEAAFAEIEQGKDDGTDGQSVEDSNAATHEESGAEEVPPDGEEDRMKNMDMREKNLLMRELKATAIEELGKEQLPTALADCFNYESEEAYRQSRDKIVKAFRSALEDAVNSRLRGGKTPKSSGEGARSGAVHKTSFAETINSMKAKR